MVALLKCVSTVLLSVALVSSQTNHKMKVERGHHWRDCLVILGLAWQVDPIPGRRMLYRAAEKQLKEASGYDLRQAQIKDALTIVMGNEDLHQRYNRDGVRGNYACGGRKVMEYKKRFKKKKAADPFVAPHGAAAIGDPKITYSAKLVFGAANEIELRAGMQLLIGAHKLQYKIAAGKLAPTTTHSPAHDVRALNKALQKLIKRNKQGHAFIQIGDDIRNKKQIVGISQGRDGKIFMQTRKSKLFKKGEKELLKEGSKITIFGVLHSYAVGKSATDDANLSKMQTVVRDVYGKEGGFMTVVASGGGKSTDFYYDTKKRLLPKFKMRYFVDGNKELTLKNELVCARDSKYWISVKLGAFKHGFGQFYTYMMMLVLDSESIERQSRAGEKIRNYQDTCKIQKQELKCYLVPDKKPRKQSAHAEFMDELEGAEADAFWRGFEKGFRKYTE